MKTVKGSKRVGAVIRLTKTWGYIVDDYKNSHDGRAVSRTCASLNEAEQLYTKIVGDAQLQPNK